MFNTPRVVLDPKKALAKYPEVRVIVLDDNFNSFKDVANSLLAIFPDIRDKKAWDLTIKVDMSGSVEVSRGNLEHKEFYHEQLISNVLTMAPIEKT